MDTPAKPTPSGEEHPSLQGDVRGRLAGQQDRGIGPRLPPWLPSTEELRKGIGNVLTIVLFGLAVALLTSAVVKESFIINPISLPKQFEERGYTGTVAAQRILDEIYNINKTATTTRQRDPFSSNTPESDLPDIQLPVGGISLATFASELKKLFHNTDQIITGEITVDTPTATTPDLAASMAPDKGAPPLTYSLRLRVSGHTAMVVPSVSIENLDRMFENAAALILEKTNPYLAASYYDAVKRPDDAQRMIESCLKDGSDDIKPWALNLRGLLAYERRDYPAAIREYQYVNEKYPKFPLSRYNLAQVYTTEANADRTDAFALDDKVRVDQLHMEEKELLQKAKKVALEGVRFDSNTHSKAIGYNNIGIALLGLAQDLDASQYDEARSFFLASTASDPRIVNAYINLGKVLRDQPLADNTSAVEWFRRASELAPDNTDVYWNWGRVLRNDGQRDEAIEKFRKAIQLDPNNAIPYYYLGLYSYEASEWSLAEQMFGKAVANSPNWPWYNYYLGLSLKNSGKLDVAVQPLKKAVELYPLNTTFNLYLGIALAEASQQRGGPAAIQLAKDARSRLNLAITLAPDNDSVKETAQQTLATLDEPKKAAKPAHPASLSATSKADVGSTTDQATNGARIK